MTEKLIFFWVYVNEQGITLLSTGRTHDSDDP